MTRMTRPMVSSSVNLTSATAARIATELSFISDTFTPAGSWAVMAGSAALMASTTSTVLASGWRWTASVMARVPSYQLA